MSYAKLFSEIVTSTIWGEDDATRIVWITMLATADKHGEVMASVPGLARMANVSVEAARKAIHTLSSPDPDSRTPDDEGRRLQPIDGGWFLINYPKYREKATALDRAEKSRIRQQRWRDRQARNANVTPSNASDTLGIPPVTHESRQNCQAEAEAEAEAEADLFKRERERAREAAENSANSEKIADAANRLLTACGFRTEWQNIPEEPQKAILSAVPRLMDAEWLDLVCRHVPVWITDREASPGRFQAVTIAEVARSLTDIYEYASQREANPGKAFRPNTNNRKNRNSTVSDRDREKTGLNQKIELPRL